MVHTGRNTLPPMGRGSPLPNRRKSLFRREGIFRVVGGGAGGSVARKEARVS